MEIAPTTKEREMQNSFTYEIRVDLVDGYEIAKLDAASIEEAMQRASKIWSQPQHVTLLGTIDRQPQKCLAC
jgi:hypothetical protein